MSPMLTFFVYSNPTLRRRMTFFQTEMNGINNDKAVP